MSTGIFYILMLFLQWNLFYCIPGDYKLDRNAMINSERNMRTGSKLTLNSREKLVDKVFLTEKSNVIKSSRVNGSLFPPAINFFQSKKLIDRSSIFKMIQQMPKGCVLHVHDSAMVSLDWVITNATYRPNCYICFEESTGNPKLHFFAKPPPNPGCKWELISTVRHRSGDAISFDQQLYTNLSIIVDDPDDVYVTVNDVWKKFGSYFNMIHGIIHYAPVFKDYIRQALREYYADNVQCIEIRTGLGKRYELDGTVRDSDWVVQTYKDIANEFRQQHPDFRGIKIIFAGYRFSPKTKILTDVKKAMKLIEKYPDFVVGYDLVGQEGIGKPLLYYIDELLYPSQQSPPVNLPYFFHSSETDWQDTQVDYNLIDAMLLNTSRIGHGFAITKHPAVRKMMIEKGIAVEVNPVSNQVLGLVTDLRNHPAVPLLAEDFPVVISSDDPACWAAKPLSHDFYMTFVGLCGEDEGIQILKQLALNSITFSAMTDLEKRRATASWTKQWDKFILHIIRTKGLKGDTSIIG